MALSQPENAEQEPKTVSEREPTANQTEQAEPALRAIKDVIESGIRADQAGQNQQHRDNRTLILVTSAAVLGAWVYAAIAAFQWCAMRKANSLAQETITNADRPWVGWNASPLTDYRVGGHPSAVLKLRNFGKSPALRVRVKSGIGASPADASKFSKVLLQEIFQERTLGPLFPDNISQQTLTLKDSLPAWAITTDSESKGAPELIVFGMITYEDRFHGLHHSPICERWHPEIGRFSGDGSCASDPTIPKTD